MENKSSPTAGSTTEVFDDMQCDLQFEGKKACRLARDPFGYIYILCCENRLRSGITNNRVVSIVVNYDYDYDNDRV